MPASPSHYDILKISPAATSEQIQAAYHALCRVYHPDVSPENPVNAHEMMAKINLSYEILSDPERRAEYDGLLDRERPAEAIIEEAGVAPEESSGRSRYFMPDEENESPPPASKTVRRQRVNLEAEQQEATEEFLAHFAKRVLLVVLVAGFLVFMVVEGQHDHDSGGWLIIRALRRVFRGW